MDGVRSVFGAVWWAPRGESTLQTAENGPTLAVKTTAAGQSITNWQGTSDSSEGVTRVNKAVEGFLHEQIMFVDTRDANKRGPPHMKLKHAMNPLHPQKGRGHTCSEKASVK